MKIGFVRTICSKPMGDCGPLSDAPCVAETGAGLIGPRWPAMPENGKIEGWDLALRD
ncbi:hypothetical protein [Paeniglutamicibacter gangotriensis]|uniref:hypothetical protein n=1 Tax=Paeniglutamicibacter gangotriensis TaxID=254787 RepID=UPI00165F2B60|nr:hypothetical protein [Paeniglutamicibacter gangotriensis]